MYPAVSNYPPYPPPPVYAYPGYYYPYPAYVDVGVGWRYRR
jgi:hypothetical protein